jgi:hypothetical protein
MSVPPVRTKRAQALVSTIRSARSRPPLWVSVPVRTSSVELAAALVTNKLPPVTATTPVAVQAELPSVSPEDAVVVPPATGQRAARIELEADADIPGAHGAV